MSSFQSSLLEILNELATDTESDLDARLAHTAHEVTSLIEMEVIKGDERTWPTDISTKELTSLVARNYYRSQMRAVLKEGDNAAI